MSRVKKSQMYLEHVPKLEKEYNNVISSNFRTLEVEKKNLSLKITQTKIS